MIREVLRTVYKNDNRINDGYWLTKHNDIHRVILHYNGLSGECAGRVVIVIDTCRSRINKNHITYVRIAIYSNTQYKDLVFYT